MQRRMKKIVYLCTAVLMVLWGSAALAQQGRIVLQGKVFSSTDGRPVDFGTVIVLEARVKVYTGTDGSYRVTVPAPGEYTVIIRTSELKMLRTKVNLTRSVTRNFYLQPLRVIGAGITITGERDIQKVSRYTMTQKNLKEVPGSFGDSISALTSLPGVIRTNGFFGPLVIRGADPSFNRYYIDDIPIFEPMHFGGIHSVINNNIMREIDLYASAFPAEFGSASAAVININTVDEVQEFGGYTDIGLISASALIQAPILRSSSGELHFAPPSWEYREGEFRNVGYAIASGRIGYLSVFIPLIYEAFTGDRPAFVPEYWDYQMKMKYYFNSSNSVTVLMMGSKDYLNFDDSDAGLVDEDNGDDPLLVGLKAQVDWSSHSQGLYYTYQPSEMFMNRIMAYAALIKYYTYFTLTNDSAADWAKDFNVDSRPYIFSIRDKFKFEPIKKHLQIRGGAGYTYYLFTAKGKTIAANSSSADFNPGDKNSFTSITLDEDIRNHSVDGYLETKVVVGGLTVVPGARGDYLDRGKQYIWDPRGMASYEFPTETTLSVAGGRYSYFFQTNPYIFNTFPQVTALGTELKPERAIHRVAGVEQKFGVMNSIKLEGFYNRFYDLATEYYHYTEDGSPLEGMSSGQIKTYGFEIMLKRDLRENEEGLFGWINYTYTRSKYKSGLPTTAGLYGDVRNQVGDEYGDEWVNYMYEQRHNFKVVAGYTFRGRDSRVRHTISAKFQYYSSMPYTAIVGSNEDADYAAANPGKHRYMPAYGYPNTERLASDHQLDLRYSFRRDYSWGYVTWYVEILNIYGQWYSVQEEYHWDFRYPYSASNPTLRETEGLRIIPNFGVEVKF